MTSDARPVLPEWTRWSWASLAEREWWNPLFDAASKAYMDVERWSVVDGVRPAARHQLSPEQYLDAVAWSREHGILCIPIGKVSKTKNYSSLLRPIQPGDSFDYQVLYVRPDRYQDTVNLEIGRAHV